MYGKLENNTVLYAPKRLLQNGKLVVNPNADILAELGYKPIERMERPSDGKIYKQEYVDSGSYITVKWVEDYAAEFEEKNRSLTTEEVFKMLITQQINTLEVDDNTAFRMKNFYPEWAAGVSYEAGFKVQRNAKLWRVVQSHTSQATWEPENAPSLWEVINETHEGTIDDPIPYSGNMALENGKYYIQDSAIYLCTRDTVNPVYNQLPELVGLYVEIIQRR